MSAHPIVVYTAVSQGYDVLKKPLRLWQREADFVAFLDNPQPGSGWEYRPIYRRFRDPCRNAKVHKVLPHRYFPDAEYSLWVDGSVAMTSTLPLANWIEHYLGRHDLAVYRHPRRQCIYEEAAHCLTHKLDRRTVIDRQMQQYFLAGYPPHNGLAECTIILRRHTKKVQEFNEAWYAEIAAHSRRDQLSFNYVARKVGLKFTYLLGEINNNPHFKRHSHTAARSAA